MADDDDDDDDDEVAGERVRLCTMALEQYDAALALDPRCVAALYGRGGTLGERYGLRRPAEGGVEPV